MYQPCFVGGKPRGQTPSPLCFGDGLCLCRGLPKAELVLKLCLLTALFNTKQVFLQRVKHLMGQGHAQGKVYVSCKVGNLPSFPCGLQAMAAGREHPARGNTEAPAADFTVQAAEPSLGL